MTILAKGDVVELKSGGPEMTVSDVGYEGGAVMCSWFSRNDEVKQQLFHPDASRKIR